MRTSYDTRSQETAQEKPNPDNVPQALEICPPSPYAPFASLTSSPPGPHGSLGPASLATLLLLAEPSHRLFPLPGITGPQNPLHTCVHTHISTHTCVHTRTCTHAHAYNMAPLTLLYCDLRQEPNVTDNKLNSGLQGKKCHLPTFPPECNLSSERAPRTRTTPAAPGAPHTPMLMK